MIIFVVMDFTLSAFPLIKCSPYPSEIYVPLKAGRFITEKYYVSCIRYLICSEGESHLDVELPTGKMEEIHRKLMEPSKNVKIGDLYVRLRRMANFERSTTFVDDTNHRKLFLPN